MQLDIWHLLQGGILGLVQGLTEFIPISSSGHLVIVRELLGMPDQGNFFDAILHIATLLAVLIYFYRDWWQMLQVAKDKPASKTVLPIDRRLLLLLIVSTIPALAIGYFIQGWIEHNLRSLLINSVLLIVMGIVLTFSDSWFKNPKYNRNLSLWDAVNIGLAQVLAILPAVSRSATTVLAGMYVGLTREAAVKFSFLMSAPVIAIVGAYSLYESIKQNTISQDYAFLLVAFITAFLSGWLVIGWLIKFFQKHSLQAFGIYSIVAEQFSFYIIIG